MKDAKGTQSRNISILPLIPEGKNNAISMAELSRLTDQDGRTVRKAIEKARRNDAIICSSKAGYYTPASTEELQEFYKSARKRAMTTLTVLKSTRRMLKALEDEGAKSE